MPLTDASQEGFDRTPPSAVDLQQLPEYFDFTYFFFDPASSKSWTTSESRRQDRFKHRTGGSYFIEKTELGHQKLEESYISYLLNPNGHGGRILFAESVIKVKQEF
jgi:hypothetical protein